MDKQRISTEYSCLNHNVENWLSHIEVSLPGSTAADLQKHTALVCILPTEVDTQVFEVISILLDNFAHLLTALKLLSRARQLPPPKSVWANLGRLDS
ncbi:hypothetical protein Hamer_G026743 [Homarus americanus]|uniref:Uncharacterized protein n=1 Tax=Homarus americanus TaxID=6706 RepID=A0A8J5K6P0_HOMAM|nr:hypothetical protein Hamer_G006503 [Homarus americanus]KAG7168693.1 hypothetical protein Hamer_G026743 [Homarus americanus]